MRGKFWRWKGTRKHSDTVEAFVLDIERRIWRKLSA